MSVTYPNIHSNAGATRSTRSGTTSAPPSTAPASAAAVSIVQTRPWKSANEASTQTEAAEVHSPAWKTAPRVRACATRSAATTPETNASTAGCSPLPTITPQRGANPAVHTSAASLVSRSRTSIEPAAYGTAASSASPAHVQ